MADNPKRIRATSRRSFLGGTLVGLAAGSMTTVSAQVSSSKPGPKSKNKLTGIYPEGAPAALGATVRVVFDDAENTKPLTLAESPVAYRIKRKS